MAARVRVDPRTNRLYLDLHVEGRRRRVFSKLPDTPRNRSVLQAKAETIDREVFLGTFEFSKHFGDGQETKSPTFKELYEEWRKKKASEVSPLTLKWYAEVFDGRVLPFWGPKRLEDFTPQLFDQYKAQVARPGLSPRYVNIALARLKELLRMAQDRGYIREDLARWVVFQRQRRPDIAPLSFEEKVRFIKALPLRWRPYFEVAFGTGLRPSEQIALTWDRVDFKRKVIEVRQGWRKHARTNLKTAAASRDVDMLPAVQQALERQRLIAGGSELVFPNPRGGHINAANFRVRVWLPTLAKVGLKKRHFYNTRHTFATHALASGEDPGWVAKMLGHTTLLMLTTVYYRYIPNLTRRDGTLLAKRLGSLPG